MDDITVSELKQKMDSNEQFVFIDVREQTEYEDFNLGAQLIPLGSLVSEIPNLLKYKDEEIIVHCRSGARSGSAKITLSQMGFTKVRNLLGGILEWERTFGRQ
ncbi:MAG: rhodanese-like domain-containing protein [Saprospiraceae bacterium]|jgi:rhodanese-related sulfurtransferase